MFFNRKKQQAELLQAYKEVFNSPNGKLILHDLMSEGHFISPTHTKRDSVNETLINEGKRNLVLYIICQFKTSPELIMKFFKEAEQHKENHYAIMD